MARVIAVASQKGGAGKTTTTIHLAAGMDRLDRKVLAVDMDPQGHLAQGFGLPAQEIEHEISEVLERKRCLTDTSITRGRQLALVPANIRLSSLEASLMTRLGRESRLRSALRPHLNKYDFALIDCPPSLGILTVNALAACQEVLIPMTCEYFSMLGVSLLLQTIEEMREEINPELRVLGILPTRFNRTVHAREVLARTRAELGDTLRIFDPIPESTRVKEASALGETIYQHAPESPVAEAYEKLVKEVISAG